MRRGWIRVVRGLLPATTVPVALAGAVTTPAAVLFTVGPLLGLFCAGVVLTVDPARPVGPRTRRNALVLGAAGAGSLPFASGIGLLGPAGLPLALGALLLACCLGVDALVRGCAGEPASGGSPVAELIPVLATEDLLALWQATGTVLRRNPDERARAGAAQLRAALLDELTRRDPAGVERWLQAGSDSPEGHIRPGLGG